ncbi:HepT-like ribonuclease domain-containing protein [Halanaerobium congolense]
MCQFIEILAENNIIKENVESYIKMAKFRNIIVHDYAEIDPEILLVIIKENLSDLKAIFKWFKEYID